MKKIIVLTSLVISSTVFANVGEVFTFGRGNVMSANLSNGTSGTKLQLVKNNDLENYYEMACTKSSLFKKNHLVFKKVNLKSKEVAVQAESDVKDCSDALKNIYSIAFEKKAQAVVALTEEANADGIYGLNVSVNYSVDVVK